MASQKPKITDTERSYLENRLVAIMVNLRKLYPSPFDAAGLNTAPDFRPGSYSAHDYDRRRAVALANDTGAAFFADLLPDNLTAAYHLLSQHGYKVHTCNTAEFLILNPDAPRGWTGIRIRANSLYAPMQPIRTDKRPPAKWMQWFKKQHSLDPYTSAIQWMRLKSRQLNTYGQLVRMWPGIVPVLPQKSMILESVENIKVRSRMPFALPYNHKDICERADMALDNCLVQCGDVARLQPNADTGSLVQFAPGLLDQVE